MKWPLQSFRGNLEDTRKEVIMIQPPKWKPNESLSQRQTLNKTIRSCQKVTMDLSMMNLKTLTITKRNSNA